MKDAAKYQISRVENVSPVCLLKRQHNAKTEQILSRRNLYVLIIRIKTVKFRRKLVNWAGLRLSDNWKIACHKRVFDVLLCAKNLCNLSYHNYVNVWRQFFYVTFSKRGNFRAAPEFVQNLHFSEEKSCVSWNNGNTPSWTSSGGIQRRPKESKRVKTVIKLNVCVVR